MSRLLYREDIDEVRKRLTVWWNGGDIGRPAMMLTTPRSKPLEDIEAMPKPENWLTDWSTSNFDYRVNLARRHFINGQFLGESVPQIAPHLGTNCLALYLGCHGVEQPGTVWAEPCINQPEDAKFDFNPENFYWNFTLRLGRELVRIGKGKFLVEFPDLLEGLDTLGAMRGAEKLLLDMIERPEWVHDCLRKITDVYFHYYDILYDIFRDETGGSGFWMFTWAPGRMGKVQCDCSAMISPGMFDEFMVPVLTEMCERVSYSVYHLDGPGAIPHLEHVLSIPKLKMLQWTPGEGAEPAFHKRWWPIYHKAIDAGKKVLIHFFCDNNMENLKELKNEFGNRLKQAMIQIDVKSPKQADEALKIVSE